MAIKHILDIARRSRLTTHRSFLLQPSNRFASNYSPAVSESLSTSTTQNVMICSDRLSAEEVRSKSFENPNPSFHLQHSSPHFGDQTKILSAPETRLPYGLRVATKSNSSMNTDLFQNSDPIHRKKELLTYGTRIPIAQLVPRINAVDANTINRLAKRFMSDKVKSEHSNSELGSEGTAKTGFRPLSPHLPVYEPQLNSTLSIFHRITGAFLSTVVLLGYLLTLKMGLICYTYESFYQLLFYSSKLTLIGLEISALAFAYHMVRGISHLRLPWNLKQLKI